MPDNANTWMRAVEGFLSPLLKLEKPPKTIPLPSITTEPTANALLLRGVSWRDDDTFEILEYDFSQSKDPVNPFRFSYGGFKSLSEPPDYSPRDIFGQSMVRYVDIADDYIRNLLRCTTPLNMIAFSLGGLVAANWICRPDPPSDHHEIVAQIRTLTLIGTPMNPPARFVRVRDPSLGIINWEHSPTVVADGEHRAYDRSLLLVRYPNLVINVVGDYDTIAREEYAALHGSAVRLKQHRVPTNHRRLPNHSETVRIVAHFIDRNKRQFVKS